MPARANRAPTKVHIDIVPVVERIADLCRGDRVSNTQITQRLIRKNDAPAEGIERAIALHDADFVLRVLQLHQKCKVQTRRATADAKDAHIASDSIHLFSVDDDY